MFITCAGARSAEGCCLDDQVSKPDLAAAEFTEPGCSLGRLGLDVDADPRAPGGVYPIIRLVCAPFGHLVRLCAGPANR